MAKKSDEGRTQYIVIVNWNGGRHLSLASEQIEYVLRHWLNNSPELSQTAYCKQLGISRMTYWRVTRFRLKHKSDRDRVAAIANERLNYDIRAATGVYDETVPFKEDMGI